MHKQHTHMVQRASGKRRPLGTSPASLSTLHHPAAGFSPCAAQHPNRWHTALVSRQIMAPAASGDSRGDGAAGEARCVAVGGLRTKGPMHAQQAYTTNTGAGKWPTQAQQVIYQHNEAPP